MQFESNQFPEVISLNVGGHIYTTTLCTLRKLEPNSMLARMFSGLMGVRKDAHGNYFIDRDGTHFGYILNYLRDGDVDLPSNPLIRKQLLRECLFYQVQGLIERLGAGAIGEGLIPPPAMASAAPNPSSSSPSSSPPSSPGSSVASSYFISLSSPSSSSAANTSNWVAAVPPSSCIMLDQAVLYGIQKEFLFQKHRRVWEETKVAIKKEFEAQAQSESSHLMCRFPMQQELLVIVPFVARELQEEGLRDLTFTTNFQTGITFSLNLDKISDADYAEQQFSAVKLALSAQSQIQSSKIVQAF